MHTCAQRVIYSLDRYNVDTIPARMMGRHGMVVVRQKSAMFWETRKSCRFGMVELRSHFECSHCSICKHCPQVHRLRIKRNRTHNHTYNITYMYLIFVYGVVVCTPLYLYYTCAPTPPDECTSVGNKERCVLCVAPAHLRINDAA